jgi:hypothetical protein
VAGVRMSSVANASGAGQTAAHAELSLIEALRQGDEDEFGRLVDQYHASLRRVARLYVSNRAVVDEVVQDTSLREAKWSPEELAYSVAALRSRSAFTSNLIS